MSEESLFKIISYHSLPAFLRILVLYSRERSRKIALELHEIHSKKIESGKPV